MKNYLLGFLFLAITANAADVDLEWDANTELILGYKLYSSQTSGIYLSPPVTVGLVTQAKLTGFTPGNVYYFVATAFDAELESGYSNEVKWTPPIAPILSYNAPGKKLVWVDPNPAPIPPLAPNNYTVTTGSLTYNTSSTELSVVGLPSGTYTVSVTTTDGTSSPSNVQIITNFPSVPKNLRIKK